MKKILITGATGFTGEFILRYLKSKFENIEIIGTGRNLEKAKNLISQGFNIKIVELSNKKEVLENFFDIDTVVHCAAKSSPWGTYKSFYKDNVLTTQNILDLPLLQKIIYISTPSIYFNFKNRYNIKETDELPKKMVNHYATTKYKAEQEIFNSSNSITTKIILRPRAIIGAGDTTIMPRVINAYKKNKLKIIGNGKNITDFTSIRNIAYAVFLSLKIDNNLNNGAYNITDDENLNLYNLMNYTLTNLGYNKKINKIPYFLVYTIAKLTEIYYKLFSKKEPTLTCYGIGVLKYSLTMNIEKAKTKLNYKPIIKTTDSIQEFIKWYNEQKQY